MEGWEEQSGLIWSVILVPAEVTYCSFNNFDNLERVQ